MLKWRKRPIVVEAFRLGIDACPQWFMDMMNINDVYVYSENSLTAANIRTLEGWMVASHGDFIVKGVFGEVYPVKPDVFMATYERVEE